jgi:serine/threonine protein kinase
MRFCPLCRYCYENHDTVCVRGDGAPLKDWPQRKDSDQESWVSGPCQLIERYRLVRLISSGGMGTIFEGVDKNLDDRPVAIKILHRYAHLADPDALERFRREARAASRVSHPNLAVVYDYGVSPEWGAFIVMELIDGENLAKRLKTVGRLPLHVACQIAQQIAYGIGALHRSGFVHRDLKPSNVIITFYDEDEKLIRINVVDFGIVKAISPFAGDEATPTNPGLYVGTPSYMSPEHCASKPLDARSDIYSLGVLLFETLAGRRPFTCRDGEDVILLSKHLTEQPPLLREVRPEVPEALESLVDEALRKNPTERPQSANEFARALRAFTYPDVVSTRNVSLTEAKGTLDNPPVTTEPETQTVVRSPASDDRVAEQELQQIADRLEENLFGEHLIQNGPKASRAETPESQATALAVTPADALPVNKSIAPDAFGAAPEAQDGNGTGPGLATTADAAAEPFNSDTASTGGAADTVAVEDGVAGVGAEPVRSEEATQAPPEHEGRGTASRNGDSHGIQHDGDRDESVNVDTAAEAVEPAVEGGESVIQGMVVRRTAEGVVVNFGFAERLVGWDKFTWEQQKKVIAPSKGQRVEASIVRTDSPEGFTLVTGLRPLPQPHDSSQAVPGEEHAPKEQPVNQGQAAPVVSDNRVVVTAVLTAAFVVTLIAVAAFLLIRLSAQPSPAPRRIDVPTEVESTEVSICLAGSECVAAEDSHLRVAPGKFNDQGEENESVGIATKGSRVEVLEVDSGRKNWRRVRILEHGRRKKLMWREEGWMDGGNLRPVSEP